MLSTKYVLHLILLVVVRLAVAIPLNTPSLKESKSRPQTQPSSKSSPQSPSTKINWKALRPYLGAVGILSLVAGVAIMGTKLEEFHSRAVEAHKREKFQQLIESQAWIRELPASISGEEKEALANVVREEHAQLALEEQRYKEKEETLRRDMIIKYFDVAERIQKNHRNRKEDE
jgi:hypothetical protein